MITIRPFKSDSGMGLDRERASRPTFHSALTMPMLTSMLMLAILLIVPAMGSTPGCADCPDWVNFNSWWDRYHSEPAQKDPGPSPRDVREMALQERAQEEDITDMDYPAAELLVHAEDDLEGKVVLDSRAPEDYEEGHLPGSRNLYWRAIQSGGVLSPDLAEEELSRLGVNETDPIVVCGSAEGSAYLFWALDYLGHENLSRLDGDVAALSSPNLVQNAPTPAPSNYTIEVEPWLLADEAMLEESQENLGVQIVDARPSFADYGISRLKNSVYVGSGLVYSDSETHTLKGAGYLERLFDDRGLDRDRVQLVYGTPDACTLYFALNLMGYNATVLDGDWWQKTEISVSAIS